MGKAKVSVLSFPPETQVCEPAHTILSGTEMEECNVSDNSPINQCCRGEQGSDNTITKHTFLRAHSEQALEVLTGRIAVDGGGIGAEVDAAADSAIPPSPAPT